MIGTGEPPVETHFDVNLIGEYNIAGNLWLLEPLLAKAGIRAKLKVKLRGDLAARLEGCGLRNEDRVDVLEDFPLAVLLNDLPYRGAERVSLDAARDDRASAKLLD